MAIGRREVLLLGAAAAAAAGAGALGGALFVQTRSGAAGLLSARYPDLHGQQRRLLDWQGRVVLCNFWATWCAPCREEVPLLIAAKERWSRASFEIVGIGIDSTANIREFLNSYRVNYPVLIGNATAVGLLRKLGNQTGALPYTVVLDRTGSVTHRHLGAFTEIDLGRVLESLFG